MIIVSDPDDFAMFLTRYTVDGILSSAKRRNQESVRISCGENGIIPLAVRDEVIYRITNAGKKVSGVVNSDDIVVWLK